ncbi:MAG: COX15/CtaA family protein, partial [Pseudomonadota bacterium]
MNKSVTEDNSAYAIAAWLYSVCALVFIMIIVGAITRLTDSGLSMVEWRPLLGTLPPMNEAEWNRVFDLYKAFPEFEKQNFWMELS